MSAFALGYILLLIGVVLFFKLFNSVKAIALIIEHESYYDWTEDVHICRDNIILGFVLIVGGFVGIAIPGMTGVLFVIPLFWGALNLELFYLPYMVLCLVDTEYKDWKRKQKLKNFTRRIKEE